jgi:arsenate reductase (glutaredoxin)
LKSPWLIATLPRTTRERPNVEKQISPMPHNSAPTSPSKRHPNAADISRKMTSPIASRTDTNAMITIYHNSRCSKSRGACDLIDKTLNTAGEPVNVVEYLKHPLNVEQLKELHRMLGGSVRDMVRDTEAEFKDLGLADPSLTDSDLYKAIAAHPILLQRPIVVRNGRAVIGRPPEAVSALFE